MRLRPPAFYASYQAAVVDAGGTKGHPRRFDSGGPRHLPGHLTRKGTQPQREVDGEPRTWPALAALKADAILPATAAAAIFAAASAADQGATNVTGLTPTERVEVFDDRPGVLVGVAQASELSDRHAVFRRVFDGGVLARDQSGDRLFEVHHVASFHGTHVIARLCG